MAIEDGQTVGLAGLITDNASRGNQGLPWLKDIPILGMLGSQQTNVRERTELLVLITPKVITSGEDAKRVFDEYRRTFRSLRPLDSDVVERDTSKREPHKG